MAKYFLSPWSASIHLIDIWRISWNCGCSFSIIGVIFFRVDDWNRPIRIPCMIGHNRRFKYLICFGGKIQR